MPNGRLVEAIRKVSDKLDLAIEAGERGDWPMAERPIREAHREMAQVLEDIQTANDMDKLCGR
jgi:hypothetical protein